MQISRNAPMGVETLVRLARRRLKATPGGGALGPARLP